jgi:uncharacterized protein YcsI (UPF0317 family)
MGFDSHYWRFEFVLYVVLNGYPKPVGSSKDKGSLSVKLKPDSQSALQFKHFRMYGGGLMLKYGYSWPRHVEKPR